MDERVLAARAAGGDKDAFCSLYGLYRDRLYRYALYRLGDQKDAEDAVSECVLSAWRQIGGLREPGAFGGWIFRILSGCCAHLIRRQIEQRDHVDLGSVPEQAAENPSQIDDMVLREALERLSGEEREIVLLSFVSGLSSREISEICGMTPGAVRSNLSRSLRKLRGYLS